MRYFVLTLVTAFAASGASAEKVRYTKNQLKDGQESQLMDCVTVGVHVAVEARVGRVRTYETNAPGFASGVYVGAVKGRLNTIKNTTAPRSGLYRIKFSRAVQSLEFKIDAISNVFQPAETLLDFRTDVGNAQISFSPANNGAMFDEGSNKIVATGRNGDGTIQYQSSEPFRFFEFSHEQHPQNIGFTISDIVVGGVQGNGC